ncbi:MAG: glycerol-3-phosphate acyltransferase PlsY [Psychrosphaera sp.]|jgi:glycerol-3-phosphate acyltransferase PlsY|uniref:Glycerol-3-phosphate acyltransferase n=1 Tax=Psychrosphaera aquimarina TaxID=2044854 RepID=A0ABU3R437_9GAMM|nr:MULTISPECIES: glycerol-3-phosphate 1-O-acyltransferase PlsY [Psychrosphaera]MBU2917875.1 glycerol-3-phosphate 1-O-acyltransferase PlsY [Psychrosphaera sp. F3M07]MDU0114427.1 glycerol-3-phosphate 1-O-acyltransferase PlsY [Psychrosphaera aquimarina]
MQLDFLLVLIISYLLGSINSAIIFSKLQNLPDPRTVGSNNPGATNVYRMAGKTVAIAVLFFDVLKGIIATWGSYYIGLTPTEIGFAGLACCLGHMFPVFFKFQGGKAVATGFGCLLPVGITLGISLLCIWYLVFRKTGYSSIAAIISVGISPLVTLYIADKYVLPVSMIACLIVLRHMPNVLRLLDGTEPKTKRN